MLHFESKKNFIRDNIYSSVRLSCDMFELQLHFAGYNGNTEPGLCLNDPSNVKCCFEKCDGKLDLRFLL